MLISVERKIIFIAVPKTGTSSISQRVATNSNILRNKLLIRGTMVDTGNEHVSALELKRLLWEEYDEYEKFACVRNPWDKAVSAYFYYKNGRASRFIWYWNRVNFRMVVNVFLAKILPFKIWLRIHPLRSCSDYLCDEKGNLLVDQIVKFENLSGAYSLICKKFEIAEEPLDHRNKSKHKPYQYYYSPAARDYVSRKFRNDIEHFGYSFDEK